MSDFFSDDFTAELKTYFLESLVAETQKFMDLLDNSTWKRIYSEVVEQTKAWAVDAKTNEFLHLTIWLEKFEENTKSVKDAQELTKSLQALKNYAEALKVDRVDSPELSAKCFPMAHGGQSQALFLHCLTGQQEYAIPLLSVVEISGSLPLFSLPQKKLGLMGVVPYRGEAVPVLNLQDHGFEKMDSQNIFYVICEHNGVRFSLPITATRDLVNLRDSELHNVESQKSIMQVPFVNQFFIKENKSVMILDLEKLVA